MGKGVFGKGFLGNEGVLGERGMGFGWEDWVAFGWEREETEPILEDKHVIPRKLSFKVQVLEFYSYI